MSIKMSKLEILKVTRGSKYNGMIINKINNLIYFGNKSKVKLGKKLEKKFFNQERICIAI